MEVQGQEITGQGHSVTKHINIKKNKIQARISCRWSNLVKIITEPCATR